MRRKAHILSVPKRVVMPKHIIFFDTETKDTIINEKQKLLTLRLGVAIYCRHSGAGKLVEHERYNFSDPDDFNRWLMAKAKRRKEIYVVAHNIGFDIRITGSFKFLSQNEWRRTHFIDEGINFTASFTHKRARIKFINNQQLFNVSLKMLGESIGTYKSQVDFTTVSDDELRVYCLQDVRVMIAAWRIWLAYIINNDLGSFKITAASQAMEAFRHRFMKEPLFIHTHEKAIQLERESYHGGRVECFFIGHYDKGKVYCVDINSMYPFVMKEPVPVKLIKHYARSNLAQFTALRNKYGYIADVTLELLDPVLPVVVNGGKLAFPTGMVRGVFTKPEIELAEKHGTVRKVHALNIYSESPILTDFVEYFWEARQKFKNEGNVAFSYISKLLMNSLYGKFGQRHTEYTIIGSTKTIPDGMYKTALDASGKLYNLRILDGIIEKETGQREAYHAFPAIASYVTARARVYLYSLIERANRGDVLYCDTDSLFVTESGYTRLAEHIENTRLGYLKLVGIEESMTVHAPKYYSFGSKVVQKGIRHSAIKLAPFRYEQEKFVSFRGALRAHNVNGVTVIRIVKKIHPRYDKGTVTSSGLVVPLHSPQFA